MLVKVEDRQLASMVLMGWLLGVRKAIVRALIHVIELFLGPLTLRSLALDCRLNPAERIGRVEQALHRSFDSAFQRDWDSGEDTDEAELVLADEVSDSESRSALAKHLSKSLRIIREYKGLCKQVGPVPGRGRRSTRDGPYSTTPTVRNTRRSW